MAGTIKQLKENIRYMQTELKGLSAQERSEVFKGDEQFKDFTDALKDMYELISKLEKAGALPDNLVEEKELKEDSDKLAEALFWNERRALISARELKTKKGQLLNNAIKGLTQEIDDFNKAISSVIFAQENYEKVEKIMRAKNNVHEKKKLEPSAQRQQIMLKSYLTDPAVQKKDVDEMNKLLKSTKSIFIKNSPYFNALEDSLKALKDFTDKIPQGQQKLDDAQTLKLTELYQNAYKAADSYINRNVNYTVRGNRMNMAIRLRETLRTGAAAHMGLERRKKEEQMEAVKKKEQMKAAKKVNKSEKERVSVSKLLKELKKENGEVGNASARRNSFVQKKQQPSADIANTISRQKTLGN